MTFAATAGRIRPGQASYERLRPATCLLALIVAAQVASCVVVSPALVARPAAAVFDACNTWAEPDVGAGDTFWCSMPEQGDREPSLALLGAFLLVLVVSVFSWLVPTGGLLARFQDWTVARATRRTRPSS